MLRYFRHPALAFWALVVLVACTVGAVALAHHTTTAASFEGIAPPLPNQGARVFALAEQVATLPAAERSGHVSAWAAATSRMAQRDALALEQAGALATNSVVVAYEHLAQAASIVPSYTSPLVAATRMSTALGQLERAAPVSAPPSLPRGN